MYNRYIPQQDGSYRRSRMGEQPVPQRMREPPSFQPPQEPILREECAEHQPCQNIPRPKPVQAGGFLKNLLPQGLDTEDLLIVLLLLLMSGECREDRNLPLLTLALYLFL